MTLFGTDGVRGVAGVDLTADLARSIASAAVPVLAAGVGRPLVAVGRDPRVSGGWLQDAVVDGLTAAGADVALLGVIPTPAVARAIADGLPGQAARPTFGVVISASHNPAPDNGIKLFGPGGRKLDEATERQIEQLLDNSGDAPARPGKVAVDLSDNPTWYVDALLRTTPVRLDGLKVLVDCANGAAATVAAAAYGGAGADVTVINTDLSGEHINDGCGATHLDGLAAAVRSSDAELGIAHDGDADRCLAVTSDGEVVDGDVILSILALARQRHGNLPGGRVVVTVMSNLGLHRLMADRGIGVVTTPVGDRHVSERMREIGAVIGGEQSGHTVLSEHASTGDGILTGLHLLAALREAGQTLAQLAAQFPAYPQVLVNVRVPDVAAALSNAAPLAEAASAELGDDGRVLVRASGTEPLVRVMVEAAAAERAQALAHRIAEGIGGDVK
ncbi:MAG TPA: phosphoglucosamine mutase [Mycobacteriales bacterium]|nr:phosphoglucosamine mutase [Mycobacteriales bacterium]